MKKVEDFLEQLGLSSVEAKIYQGLLKHGPTTVKDLAACVGLNRVTTHFQVNNLIHKGLVTQLKTTARRQIAAEPPEHLYYLIEKKEKEINSIKSDYTKITAILNEFSPKNQVEKKLTVKYIEGKLQVRILYDDIIKAKEVWSVVNLDKVLSAFPENQNKFSKVINSKQLKLWEIIESDKKTVYLQSLNKEYYHCKLVPKNTKFFEMDWLLFEETVVFIDYTNTEPVAIQIFSLTLYKALKSVFNFLWSSLPDN